MVAAKKNVVFVGAMARQIFRLIGAKALAARRSRKGQQEQHFSEKGYDGMVVTTGTRGCSNSRRRKVQ